MRFNAVYKLILATAPGVLARLFSSLGNPLSAGSINSDLSSRRFLKKSQVMKDLVSSYLVVILNLKI